MLKITQIEKTFHPGTINENSVLKKLSLTLNDGDFVTVIGGNGAGKSTLLNSIAGVVTIDGGIIELDGVDISLLPDYKRSKYIGRVFQDPLMGSAGDMEIIENLAMANRRGKHRTLRWGVRKKEVNHFKEKLSLLDLGLEERLNDKVGLLSGGQRQALTLLMATLQKPQLLLLDEHTAALDPKTAAKVLTITKDIVERDQLTTLMITHNMQDAITYGNRLVMLHQGRVIFDISGEEKQKLSVQDLLLKFEESVGEELNSDSLLLSK